MSFPNHFTNTSSYIPSMLLTCFSNVMTASNSTHSICLPKQSWWHCSVNLRGVGLAARPWKIQFLDVDYNLNLTAGKYQLIQLLCGPK
jgi:hypothetical protein